MEVNYHKILQYNKRLPYYGGYCTGHFSLLQPVPRGDHYRHSVYSCSHDEIEDDLIHLHMYQVFQCSFCAGVHYMLDNGYQLVHHGRVAVT